MQLTPYFAFALLAAGQAVFLALMLVQQRGRLGGERWLAALLLLLALELATVIYVHGHLYRQWPLFIGVDAGTTFLYGPLLWLFITAATGGQRPHGGRLWLHFVPALLMTVIVQLFIWHLPLATRASELDRALAAPPGPSAWVVDPFALLAAIQAAFYIHASWRRVANYRRRLLDERSTLEQTPVRWLRAVLRVFIALWLCFVVLSLFVDWLGYQQEGGQVMTVALIVTVFYLGYRVWLAQPVRLVLAGSGSGSGSGAPPDGALAERARLAAEPGRSSLASGASGHVASTAVVPGMATAEAPAPAGPVAVSLATVAANDIEPVATDGGQPDAGPAGDAGKYQRSALDEAAARQLFADIDAAMHRERWWQDPELDLATLAARSGYSPHYLSQAINSGSGGNFYDYINRFRVEAVKQALLAGSDDTVLQLAFAAGFNSKSAFYAAFKRDTGLTPKAFQQQCRPVAAA